MDYLTHYDSRLGAITLAADGTHLIGLWFDGQKHFGSTVKFPRQERADLPIFNETRRWLGIYFSGTAPQFTPPLHYRMSDFRRRVCELMFTIPFGATMTYGEIARIIARERGLKTMSAQAVGGAVGHNPISLIIPCHRVLGATGALCGYAGGLDRKIALLKMESESVFLPSTVL